MNEIPPGNPSYESARDFPSFVEWGALGAGCAVGFFWWVLHRAYFVDWYHFLYPFFRSLHFLPADFDALYAYINLNVAMMQGTTVGFATSCLSWRHPYSLSVVAMLATFALKPLHDLDLMTHVARSPYETSWVGGTLAIIYLSTPLFGAYLAQRFVRDRLLKTKS